MVGWWDDGFQHPTPWVSRQDSAPRETLSAVVTHFMPEVHGADGAWAGEKTGESKGRSSGGGGWGSALERIWSKRPELGAEGQEQGRISEDEEKGHISPDNWTAPFLSCGTSNCTADACYGVQRSAGLEKTARTESAPTYVPAYSGHSAPGVCNIQEYESSSSTPEHRQQSCVWHGIYISDRISLALHQGQQNDSTRLCRNPTYSRVYRSAPTFAKITFPGKQPTGLHRDTICQGGDATAINAGVEEHYMIAGRMDPEVFRDWIPTPNPGKPSDATSIAPPPLPKATTGKPFDAEFLADQADMSGDNEASPVRRWMAAERRDKVPDIELPQVTTFQSLRRKSAGGSVHVERSSVMSPRKFSNRDKAQLPSNPSSSYSTSDSSTYSSKSSADSSSYPSLAGYAQCSSLLHDQAV